MSRTILLLLLCVFALTGCGANRQFEKTFADLRTLDDGRRHFGSPDWFMQLQDDNYAAQWRYYREYVTPGHYEWRDVQYQLNGVWYTRTESFWVPEQVDVYYCTADVVADENKKIFHRKWRGNSCNSLVLEP